MLEPLENINKVLQKKEVGLSGSPNAKVPKESKAASSADSVSDNVDIHPAFVVDTVKGQTQQVKDELPELIIAALTAEEGDEQAQQAPFELIQNRLTDPLISISDQVLGQEDGVELVNGFVEELSRFRSEILAFRDNALLAPIAQQTAESNPLNNLLFALNDKIDGVIQLLREKI